MKQADYYSVTKKKVELRNLHEVVSYKHIPWSEALRAGEDHWVDAREVGRHSIPIKKYSKMDFAGNVTSIYAAIDETLLELMGCAKVDFDRELARIKLRDEAARKHSHSAKRFEEGLRNLTLWGRVKWAFKPVYCRK